MIGRSSLVLLVSLLAPTVFSAETAKPLLVVVENNPWLSLVGADSPKFALYDDGTVIYRSERPTPDEPFVMRKVADAAALQKQIVSFDADKIASQYRLSEATDQISTVIWLPNQTVTIYGDWRKPNALAIDSDPEMRAFSFQEKKRWE